MKKVFIEVSDGTMHEAYMHIATSSVSNVPYPTEGEDFVNLVESCNIIKLKKLNDGFVDELVCQWDDPKIGLRVNLKEVRQFWIEEFDD